MHPHYETPYRWHNVVAAARADHVEAEARRRWPSVRITRKAVLP